MADVSLVTLELDSTGVVSGEKQATASLRLVESAMQRTEKQSQQLNAGLNANIKKSGDSFKAMSDSASRAGASLSSLGGPVGRIGGEISNLSGQMSGLIDSFGLMGGAALGAVGAIAAVGAAVVKLTLDGINLSDNLGDLGQSLGFSAEQMEKLNAASRLAGEDVGTVERAFATFQGTIKSALLEPTGEAATALRVLGINAKAASKDTQGAFLDMLGSLSSVTANFDELTAARDVFGRGTHSLIRTSEEFTRVLKLTNNEMVAFGYAATESARQGAAAADKAINEASLKFETFKRELATTWAPSIVSSLNIINAGLKEMQLGPFGGGFVGGALKSIVSGGGPAAGATPQSVFDEWRGGKQFARDRLPPPPPRRPGGASALPGLPVFGGLTFEKALQLWNKGMEQVAENAQGVANGLAAANARMLEILGGRVGNIMRGVPLPLQPGLIQQGGPGQPFAGAPIFEGLPDPKDIRTVEQDRLDQQFALIFDDMLISILTAQKTLGGAFADLALGVADTLAVEFTKAMRESFITPVVRGLTDLLQEGIESLFGSLKGGGGLKGIFGGIVKGIGAIFGGFFAAGGTLGANKFGVVGERGAELIYSGSSPLHVAPMATNTSGMNFTLIQNIHAPSGSITNRTRDQIADDMLKALESANRNRGAR